jgi:hypothetical protein
MRVQHTVARRRRARGAIAAVLGLVMVGVAALVPTTAASAMTQVGGVPNVVPGASTSVTVQNQSAGTGTWTITAPPETRITAARSAPGSGLGQFACTPSADGSTAGCGTSTWGAGNQVVITLTADAGATGGVKRGTSAISGVESGTYAVTVIGLAPVNRLQCTTLDDVGVTPVYGKTSTGLYTPAAPGTDLGLDTKASAFPPTTGTYSAATSSFYSSYGPAGYGDTTVYRGELAIGAQNVTDPSDSTVTISLPYAQRLQFTIGGMDAPSVVDVTGAGPDGAIVPSGAARSTEPGSTTTSTVGDSLHVVGSSAYAQNADPIPEKSADVWFEQPVTSITLHQYGQGAGNDGGYVITPALGCQTGTVSTADAQAVATDVSAADGDTTVTYEVPVTTTVTNTAAASDMQLVPAVRSDLAARVQDLGGSLDALSSTSTGACALPSDALTSDLLTASSGALAPDASCVQRATATVTLPLDADPRTLSITSTLASSTDQSASRVKDDSTASLTFPAVRSALTVVAAGPSSGLPTAPVTKTFTVRGTGPDTSGRSTISIDDPEGFPVRSCSVSGLATQPSCDDLLSGDPVPIGTVAAGATRTVTIRGVVPDGTAAGTTWPLTASVSSPVDSTSPHVATTTFTVAAPGKPGVTEPAAGSTTTDRRPTIAGNNVPNRAAVAVYQGERLVCRATGDRGGYWSCEPTADFAIGSVTLRVTDTFGGITGPEGGTSFTVTRPAAQPGGTGPSGGTGGGSAGGPAGNPGPTDTGGGTGAGAPAGPSSASPTPGSGSGSGNSGENGDGDVNGGGSGSGGGSGAGGPDAAGTDDGPMAMDLRFGTQRILPGTAADMRGTLGPNASGATVAITFQARMSTGMVYRNVDVEVDDQPLDCTVATTSFSCMIPLDPGQQADVDVRVYADPVNAPDTAVQQISLASNRASQANAITVTTAVAKGATEASQLADQITTFNVTEFPGAMVPLLAMLLFALAATVAGRRAASGPAAAATTPPTGSGPPEPSRASSPTSPRPTTDPPSGSNR